MRLHGLPSTASLHATPFFSCDKCAIFAPMAAFIEKTLKTRSKRKSANHTRPLYFGIQINFPM
ncbi:hypothetical protein PSP6_130214 [Paraburkholderia tropica]|nr:hypothetical protein PSP6_130214 [Paraburkholderia tropica]